MESQQGLPECAPFILGIIFFHSPLLWSASHSSPSPPVADKVAHTLEAHGHTRVDNYYWMRLSDEQKTAENPDEQTQKVLDYLTAENDYLKASLKHTEGFQEALFEEIIGRIKQDDESVPYSKNGYWYYSRFEEGKEYPIYCRKQGTMDAAEEVTFDANVAAEGHEYYNAVALIVSPDNNLMAFSEDTVGRRRYTTRFKNLRTGEILPDKIPNVEPGVAWANDNKTLFYTSKNEVTLLSEKIKRHTLGKPVSEDAVVYHEKDTSFYINVYRSKSGKFIQIVNDSTLVSDHHLLSADDPMGEFRRFSPREKDHLYSIVHYEDKFFIISNWDAQNFRLMEVDDDNTAKENWREVIPHRPNVLLERMMVFESYLVLQERGNGQTKLRIRNHDSKKEHYLEFDESAYRAGFSTNADMGTDWLRFSYSSLTTPVSIYDYHMGTKEKLLKKRYDVVGGHDPGEYKTKRLWANARDGTAIPLSIVYKHGYEKGGGSPLLLYGYGSYGNTVDPSFSSVRLSLLDRGFAYAIAHIRGSEMLGRQWYLDGKLLKKKNTFYDFIDVAKFLIEEGYTSSDHLYAMGGSAGGLLMGAVLNEEPTLFKGVVAAVPFVDVLTTMSDPSIPLTTNEYDEWGNPADKPYYEYMGGYSPQDNIRSTEYSNLLVTSGLFDSQVQYWEPTKWVAKLRAHKTGTNKVFLYTEMEAGHGGASGRFKRHKETALQYAFLLDLEGISE